MNFNSQQKKLLKSLVVKASEICDSLNVKDTSYFFSIFYAIVKLKQSNCRKPVFCFEDYKHEIGMLHEIFPELIYTFENTLKLIHEDEANDIYNIVLKIQEKDEEYDNSISWIYQLLKKSTEKAIFSKIGENNNKIKGRDLLFTTQFFTDEYMVKYIVDSCVERYKNHIEDVVFVDTSLGGGNFLTYAFHVLYQWYKVNTSFSPEQIVEKITEQQLIGYDLDDCLPDIAKLSLYINIVHETGVDKIGTLYYYHGEHNDILGYLADSIKSNKIRGQSFQSLINGVIESDRPIVYITNPPFMGKRDMDPFLKEYLQEKYPFCKGDLCFSFMEKLLSQLRNSDTLGIVAQNGWMNLSSLKEFRKQILDRFSILQCVDLGSNAFFAINGEKTNIVLGVFRIKDGERNLSHFYNLKGLPYLDKTETLKSEKKIDKYKHDVNQDVFKANPNYEITYELSNSFSFINTLETYSSYAKTMQGSSTGDNKTFVKYIWDEQANYSDWKLVSKGGGFSKWEGLNIYKVKWGNNGEIIAANRGSALRNIKEIPYTELVYSDTGTLGLSVRLLMDGQVFIASGPGIKILKGDKYCHLAFLNSSIATILLKIKNPKFTVSAGYIGKLPVVDKIFSSKLLSDKAQQMVCYKKTFLMHKLPNLEFVHDDYSLIEDVDSYIESCILEDFSYYYKSKKTSDEIDSLVLDFYGFANSQLTLIKSFLGNIPSKSKKTNIGDIDQCIDSTLNENCMLPGKKLKGCQRGSENLLEWMSYEYGCDIDVLFEQIRGKVAKLSLTKEKYKQDLIHKLILEVCNINSMNSCRMICVKSKDIELKLKKKYPCLFHALGISSQTVARIVNTVHNKCFFNQPILNCYE